MSRALFLAAMLLPQASVAAGPQWIAAAGRGAESVETDILRLAYRHPLKEDGTWWTPTHAQLGASIWRVPDIRGSTRRFDTNATAIWRAERGWGYYEAGFGAYLLSKTINNEENRLPSAFQFGSHFGVGFRVADNHAVGIAVQHLSNAGIKQPNGGINLVLVQYSFEIGSVER